MDQIHHNQNHHAWKFCLFAVTILTASQISAAGFEPFPLSQQLQQQQGCVWSQRNDTGNSNTDKITGSIFCNVRTLNSDFWNYSRINTLQKQSTSSVHIKCNDKLFFESVLNQSSLAIFAELPRLVQVRIESCKIRKLPLQLANLPVWRKLVQQQLQSFTVKTFNNEWSSSIELELDSSLFSNNGGMPSSLEAIDFSFNNIWNVPNSLFCTLNHLQSLNLSHNHLIEIPNEFSSNTAPATTTASGCAFSVLDLSANAIRKLEPNAFVNAKQLVKLSLGSNYIDELEDSALNGLVNLKQLNLSSNRLVALPPSIFKPTSDLTELYLRNNSISALSASVFSNLSHLLLLDLSNNLLSSQWIKGNVFERLIRLVILKLSYNQLSYIDASLFSTLTSLQGLYLNNNRIEKLDPLAFAALTNLHVLDLSRNLLVFIDSRQFSHSFIVKQLYLDHNRIRNIDPDAFNNCTSLQDLGLAGNLLLEVPTALANVRSPSTSRGRLLNLKTLDIGENKIASVSNESFNGLTKLYGLRIVDNRITELPPNFCSSLKSLRVLNFGQNRLQRIASTAFLGCSELRALRLDKNALEELPATYSVHMPKLLWLNLTENRLKFINPAFLPGSLEWIDLSWNQLESLGDFYREDSTVSTAAPPSGRTSHLRVLDASHNNLTYLDYRSIPISLETLRLNNNKLKSIGPDTFIRARRLRRIELTENEIQSLPLASLRFSTFYVGQPPPEISFSGNPFQCSCDLEWTTRVNQLALQRQYPKIVDFDQLECKSVLQHSSSSVSVVSISTSASASSLTESGLKIPLRTAKPSDFLCPYKTLCFPLCACCEFEACDCNFQCPTNCTCHHDLSWSSNIVQCSNLGLIEHLPERIPMDATQLYLDGNNFPILSSHIFIGKRNLRVLALNSSSVQILKNKTFNGLKSLEKLYLHDNLLTQFDGYEFSDLENLVELYLHNNLLKYITPSTFTGLKLLQVLRLDGNLLYDFNVWELSKNSYLNSLMLSSNPWSCDCEFLVPFRTWIASKVSGTVVDYQLTKCQLSSSSSDTAAVAAVTVTEINQGNDNPSNYVLISSRCNIPEDINYNSNSNTQILVQTVPRNPASSNIESNRISFLDRNADEGNDQQQQQQQQVVLLRDDEDDDDNSDSEDEFSRRNSVIQEKYNTDQQDESSTATFTTTFIFWTTFGIISSLLTLILISSMYIFRKTLLQGKNRFSRALIMLNSSCVNSLKCGSSSLSSSSASSCPHHHHHHCSSSIGTTDHHLSHRLDQNGAVTAASTSLYGCPCCEQDKLFDMYFIYSRQDEDLLLYKICPELESSSTSTSTACSSSPTTTEDGGTTGTGTSSSLGLRLCLHFRDLCLNLDSNPWNSEMMASAAEASKRVVILLSGSLLATEWSNNEFRQTLSSLLSQHQKKVIFILLPPLTEQNLVGLTTSPYYKNSGSSVHSSVFSRLINSNLRNQQRTKSTSPTMLEWTDDNFWTKFKLLLPVPSCHLKKSQMKKKKHKCPSRDNTTCRQQHQSNQLQLQAQQQQQFILHPNYTLRQPHLQQQQSLSRRTNDLDLGQYNGHGCWSSQASSQYFQSPPSLSKYYTNNLTLPGHHGHGNSHGQWSSPGGNNNNRHLYPSYAFQQSQPHGDFLPTNLQPASGLLNHHQQPLLQIHQFPPNVVNPNPAGHGHEHQNSISTISNSYRPLTEQNYSDSTNTLGSSMQSSSEELDHIYSTLDSPTMLVHHQPMPPPVHARRHNVPGRQGNDSDNCNNSSSLTRIEFMSSNNSLHNCLTENAGAGGSAGVPGNNMKSTSSSGVSSCEELVDPHQQVNQPQQYHQHQHQSSSSSLLVPNHSHFRSNSSGATTGSNNSSNNGHGQMYFV